MLPSGAFVGAAVRRIPENEKRKPKTQGIHTSKRLLKLRDDEGRSPLELADRVHLGHRKDGQRGARGNFGVACARAAVAVYVVLNLQAHGMSRVA